MQIQKSILIIEDDPTTQLQIKALLKKLGIDDIEIAPEGGAGLQALRRRSFDLVLCDVMMSGIGGLEFLTNLRKNSYATLPAKRCNTPVIFLTAHADKTFVMQAKALRAQGYLLKPLKMEALKKRLDVLLG